jgi:hypothetical protein
MEIDSFVIITIYELCVIICMTDSKYADIMDTRENLQAPIRWAVSRGEKKCKKVCLFAGPNNLSAIKQTTKKTHL